MSICILYEYIYQDFAISLGQGEGLAETDFGGLGGGTCHFWAVAFLRFGGGHATFEPLCFKTHVTKRRLFEF